MSRWDVSVAPVAYTNVPSGPIFCCDKLIYSHVVLYPDTNFGNSLDFFECQVSYYSPDVRCVLCWLVWDIDDNIVFFVAVSVCSCCFPPPYAYESVGYSIFRYLNPDWAFSGKANYSVTPWFYELSFVPLCPHYTIFPMCSTLEVGMYRIRQDAVSVPQ